MIEIIKLLGISAMSFLFVAAEPMILIKTWMFNYIYKKDYTNLLIWKLINCALCSGFWIGLVITRDALSASIIAVIAEAIYQKLSSGKL
jgi:hypothetical protein